MKRLKVALVAAFALLAVLLCGSSPAAAQIRGVSTSVTSIGFGGHFDRTPGTPASVTSLGPRGYNDPTHLFVGSAFPPANPGQMRHHPHPGQTFRGGGFYPVPYTPVYIIDPSLSYNPDDVGNAPMNDPGAAVENQNLPAGPTIFDRRASGESSQSIEAAYAKRIPEQPSQSSSQFEPAPAQAEAAPVRDEPRTVLMFKDGHQLEVQNYAIIGNTLYDVAPGHRSRIPLSDLDLAATAKENDARGVDFQLPSGPGLN
jgi:hypothetical protein